MKKVAVIGGGAAGMMAALTAAEDSGNRVTIYERQQRVGRKLAATGNGRCNLTNTNACLANYHGSSSSFAEYALESFRPAEVTELFKKLGLLTVEEYGGRVYPLSDTANSVVDILRFACEARGVRMLLSAEVTAAERKGNGFELKTAEDTESYDALIIACGGAAGAKLGGVMSGYSLLQSFGHTRTALYPSLVPLTSDSEYPKALKGVRAEAELKLVSKNKVTAESRGELQFTEKGISGPVTFDISGACARLGDAEKTVHISFLYGYSQAEVIELLSAKREHYPDLTCGDAFTGMLHGRLGNMLVKYSGTDRMKKLAEMTDREAAAMARAAEDFILPVKGNGGFDAAQVTAGGIRTSEFDPHTMESRLVKGLYACGEVLDIDGDCGGFNLQWAWASGRLAGRLGR